MLFKKIPVQKLLEQLNFENDIIFMWQHKLSTHILT